MMWFRVPGSWKVLASWNYLCSMNTREQHLEAFGRLLDIMDDLREKCPWDRKQTFESLRHLTIEETYELADAILDKDVDEIRKETGDLLLAHGVLRKAWL